ncbi:Fis family transcriptional regulator [Actinophytocola xinjiangensis]|uniref:Fis family transcriptional regulator n=1 Tax=Actinophytocola xinjiangensis TaxID=485602 RepID=A0A7Z0WEV9_9PSEU|nr:PucR family transcriptional regulator [Actinophytocola xinjiangensis]OLF05023.1 Fis family transcriptional regulator [Actinophytocola xinjiangensis]
MTVEYRLDGGALPRRLADILRPELASLATEIVDEIRAKIPAYARPLDGPYGKSIRAGVQHATSLFIEQIANPDTSAQKCHDVHHKLGQNEMREGRSLDDLQAAYRVGARVSWRRMMRVGKRNGLSSSVMSQLADAVFAYMDTLASVALDGYLEAKATSAGALETWRRRLLGMILQTPAAPPAAIAELAQLIGWPVPKQATPIAVHSLPGTGHNQRKPTLDNDVLADLDGIEPKLLVPGTVTDTRLAAIRAALPGCRLSVGPCVRLDTAVFALRWARKALSLAQQGSITDGLVIRCEQHLSTVLVHSDELLLDTLRDKLMTPLASLTVKQRERTLETLRAWLDTRGSVPDMATQLGVHPQTVRYRMRQLEVSFGDLLHDPTQRFELELVLRAAPKPRAAPVVPAPRNRERR